MSINSIIYRRYYNSDSPIKHPHCVCKSKVMLHRFVIEDGVAQAGQQVVEDVILEGVFGNPRWHRNISLH